jgi:hypothetical protein
LTISSTTRIAGPFVGNGTASVFPFTFKVFAAADLDVIRLATSTGVETTLVLNSDYTVSLNGNQNTNPGGSVTLSAGALASGFTLTITSDIANLQPTDLTNQGGFYPEVITDSLDRATIQIQQMADDLTRSIKTPISDGLSLNMELPTAAVRANSFLAFDSTGEPTVVTAGSSGAPATITRQVFSGTGSQTVFTLASDPGALGNSAQVYIGGVYQQRSTYTIAGTTLTFSAAPVAGTDNIEFVNFLTSNIGATSADLVTYTPAGSGAVARSAASKFGEVVSVKDFGAVGDGVTDDTAAIQAALTASSGKSILFSGSFKITAALTVPANTELYSAFGSATITQTSANTNAFTITTNNVSLCGLTIVGTQAGTGVAVQATGSANLSIRNCSIQQWSFGTRLTGCSNYDIVENRFFAGSYDQASSADIFVYGTSGSPNRRGVIHGNYCLSNTQSGISIDLLAGDRETIVSNNIVVPCNNDGITERAAGTNYRRNGIIVGYLNGAESRAVISENIVRNIPYAGIYIGAGGSLPAGDVSVVGNLVSECGFGTLYPSDASLRAGLLYSGGGNDSITGNTILNCTTTGIKTASAYTLSSTDAPRPVISSNNVCNTSGVGILLTNKPYGISVLGNRISNSSSYAIQIATTNNPADIGNLNIANNHIDQTTPYGMDIDLVYATTYVSYVSNNKIIGTDNTTNTTDNSGIRVRGGVALNGNHIDKFYHGVYYNETANARQLDWRCANNYIANCNIGIVGGQGTGTRIAECNQFQNVTTRTNGCFDGFVVNNRISTTAAAVPAANTWDVGDHVRNIAPSVGSSKGWYCTANGTPGTWVSEGNL